jgi:hypothetical protein
MIMLAASVGVRTGRRAAWRVVPFAGGCRDRAGGAAPRGTPRARGELTAPGLPVALRTLRLIGP